MIFYKTGYKYQLDKDYLIETKIRPDELIVTPFITVCFNGLLCIKKGYAWDGASGPTIDTKNTFRASLVHDVLYQLMRQDRIPRDYRKYADELLRDILIEDGMWKIRAKLWYIAVRYFGKYTSRKKDARKTLTAP